MLDGHLVHVEVTTTGELSSGWYFSTILIGTLGSDPLIYKGGLLKWNLNRSKVHSVIFFCYVTDLGDKSHEAKELLEVSLIIV